VDLCDARRQLIRWCTLQQGRYDDRNVYLTNDETVLDDTEEARGVREHELRHTFQWAAAEQYCAFNFAALPCTSVSSAQTISGAFAGFYALEFAAYGECNAYEAWAGYESGRYAQCY